MQRIPAEAKRTESRSSACVLEAGELVSAWPPGVDIVNWNYLFGHLFESQVFPYLWKRGGIVFIYVLMYVLKVDLLSFWDCNVGIGFHGVVVGGVGGSIM